MDEPVVTGGVRELIRSPRLASVKVAILKLRGLLFVGRRYECPCCDASLRGFVGDGGSSGRRRTRPPFVQREGEGIAESGTSSSRKASVAVGGQVLEIAPGRSCPRSGDYAGLAMSA